MPDISTEEAEIVRIFNELERIDPFTNQFHLNDTCIFLIVIYSILFMYKEEIMKHPFIKKFLK